MTKTTSNPVTVSSVDERFKFSERLKRALQKQRKAVRPSNFAREFNLHAVGATVTAHAARKWLVGESIPTQERIIVLAKWLNVNAAWLRFGYEKDEGFLSTTGCSDAISKDEAALIASVISLSKPSQKVVRILVAQLHELEQVMVIKDND